MSGLAVRPVQGWLAVGRRVGTKIHYPKFNPLLTHFVSQRICSKVSITKEAE
jgi:hypothetical protein